MKMTRALLATCAVWATLGGSSAFAKDTQFWNLTLNKITKLQLSDPSKDKWGPDQTANDNDHAVDPDERLKITNITTGKYDVMFSDVEKRVCIVRGVNIEIGKVFSVDEEELKDGCKK